MSNRFARGNVFQIAPVIANVGWDKQPPLVYVTGPSDPDHFPAPLSAIDKEGKPVDCSNTSTWEWRGSLREGDLNKIEKRGEKRAAKLAKKPAK